MTKTPHTHAHNMLLYAQDAAETDKPWERWEMRYEAAVWTACTQHPGWDTEMFYRRKPRTILVNGVECPAPITEVPKKGVAVYWPRYCSEGYYACNYWNDGYAYLHQLLEHGLLYLAAEDAIARAKTMLITKEVE